MAVVIKHYLISRRYCAVGVIVRSLVSACCQHCVCQREFLFNYLYSCCTALAVWPLKFHSIIMLRFGVIVYVIVGQPVCLMAHPINLGIQGHVRDKVFVASNVGRSDCVHLVVGALRR